MTSAVKIMVTKGVRQRGINWETGYDIYSLIYTKYITDMKLLYSTENSTKYSVMTSSRIEYKKAACMYMYVCMYMYIYELPRWFSSKESACSRRSEFAPWVREIPWRRKFFLRTTHRQRNLHPWGHKEAKSQTGLIN